MEDVENRKYFWSHDLIWFLQHPSEDGGVGILSPHFMVKKIEQQKRETADTKSFCAKDRGRDSEYIKPVL